MVIFYTPNTREIKKEKEKKITNAAHNTNNINGNISKTLFYGNCGITRVLPRHNIKIRGNHQAQFMNGPPYFRARVFTATWRTKPCSSGNSLQLFQDAIANEESNRPRVEQHRLFENWSSS